MFKVLETFVRSMIRRLFLQTFFVSFQRNYFRPKMKIHYSCTSKTATLPLLSFAARFIFNVFITYICRFRATFGSSAIRVYLIIVERSMHPLVSELFLLYPYVSRCSLVPWPLHIRRCRYLTVMTSTTRVATKAKDDGGVVILRSCLARHYGLPVS